jgi:hypothetical protein
MNLSFFFFVVVVFLSCCNASSEHFNVNQVLSGQWNLDKRVYKSVGVELNVLNCTMNVTEGVHVDSLIGSFKELKEETILQEYQVQM